MKFTNDNLIIDKFWQHQFWNIATHYVFKSKKDAMNVRNEIIYNQKTIKKLNAYVKQLEKINTMIQRDDNPELIADTITKSLRKIIGKDMK